ncbi:MAG: hypothetical protein WD534_11050 [Phycisphaeraceae bacterium]
MQITRQMSEAQWVGQVYARVPPRLLWTADRVFRYAMTMAQRRLPITRFEGPLAGSGESARVVVIDHQASVAHFVQQLFDGPVEPQPAGETTWHRLPETLDRLAQATDLLLARFHAGVGGRRLDARYLRIPEAVECHAELPEDKSLPARARRGQSGNLRVLRRSTLRWELSHDNADFAQFYRQMYVPFAERRFGELASVRSAQRLRSHFLRGGLIRVLDGDTWVGGTVYSVEGDRLRVWVVGVIEGDMAQSERGVMTANWAFAFERAQQLDLRYCHMGLSRPSLRDGVLVYKKRWGAALRDGHPTHVDLFTRWDRFNPTVARLLEVSPLLFRDGPRFAGLAVLNEPATADAVERVALELAMPGLRRMCVLAPGVERVQRCGLQDARVRDLDLQLMPQVGSGRLGRLLEDQPEPAMTGAKREQVTAS